MRAVKSHSSANKQRICTSLYLRLTAEKGSGQSDVTHLIPKHTHAAIRSFAASGVEKSLCWCHSLKQERTSTKPLPQSCIHTVVCYIISNFWLHISHTSHSNLSLPLSFPVILAVTLSASFIHSLPLILPLGDAHACTHFSRRMPSHLYSVVLHTSNTSRWITFLPLELCTNISRLGE